MAAIPLEDRILWREVRKLGSRDRRVITLVLHRLAEIEAAQGAAAADAVLERLFSSLLDQRGPATD